MKEDRKEDVFLLLLLSSLHQSRERKEGRREIFASLFTPIFIVRVALVYGWIYTAIQRYMHLPIYIYIGVCVNVCMYLAT